MCIKHIYTGLNVISLLLFINGFIKITRRKKMFALKKLLLQVYMI